MREGLRKLYLEGHKKINFTAEVSEAYYKEDRDVNDILLKNVKYRGRVIAHHLWITKHDLVFKYIDKETDKYLDKEMSFKGTIIRYYHKRSCGRYLDYNISGIKAYECVS